MYPTDIAPARPVHSDFADVLHKCILCQVRRRLADEMQRNTSKWRTQYKGTPVNGSATELHWSRDLKKQTRNVLVSQVSPYSFNTGVKVEPLGNG